MLALLIRIRVKTKTLHKPFNAFVPLLGGEKESGVS
jgi:hypothetical protein